MKQEIILPMDTSKADRKFDLPTCKRRKKCLLVQWQRDWKQKDKWQENKKFYKGQGKWRTNITKRKRT